MDRLVQRFICYFYQCMRLMIDDDIAFYMYLFDIQIKTTLLTPYLCLRFEIEYSLNNFHITSIG